MSDHYNNAAGIEIATKDKIRGVSVDYGETETQPKLDSQIQIEIRHIGEGLQELAMMIDQLQKRLSLVLLPKPEDSEKKEKVPKKEIKCDLAYQLENTANYIKARSADVRSMLSRCQL